MDPGRRRRGARRLWTADTAASALPPPPMLAAGSTPAQAAGVQCSVDYRTNEWGSGFLADLTLTNAAPAAFAVNRTSRTGAHQPPVTVLTSAKQGAVYSLGDAAPLAATAAVADSARIGKAESYDDTTLLGTDTTAPYELPTSSLSVGGLSLVAKAYDSLGASGVPTPVGIAVAAGPTLVASPSQLGVQQGKSGTFTLKLSSPPSADVTVTTARTDGNAGLSVAGGSSPRCTPSNRNTAQTVTVTADTSGAGATTITSTAAGYFSPEGIPYDSVETLIVEAPDQEHETTSEERVAEYYQRTGNAQAEAVFDKGVKWALPKTAINPDGTCRIPWTLRWSGQSDTWNASSPGADSGLHVTVADYANDVGVMAAYAKTLTHYGAKSGDAQAKSTAKALLDGMISSSSTFASLCPFHKNDPARRLWAQADTALAMGSYAELLA